MIRLLMVFLITLTLAPHRVSQAQPIEGDRIGIVLLHAKWSVPNRVSSIAKTLRSAGAIVDTPSMPWSKKRAYEKTYDASMDKIDAAVKRLKEKGAKRIVVAGHSMGAIVALGYGARRKGLAGVALLAPGHLPETKGFAK